MTKKPTLSEVDARLVAILQVDGRRSFADLGAELGMSGPSAHERVRKLEARGVIRGYTADIDPDAAGFGVLAFTSVTQAPGSVAHDLTPEFAAIPEVEECHHVTGEADYILKIRARDMEHLGEVVRAVQTTRHVFTTKTDVVFSTGFEGRPLPLPDPPSERATRTPNGPPTADEPRTAAGPDRAGETARSGSA